MALWVIYKLIPNSPSDIYKDGMRHTLSTMAVSELISAEVSSVFSLMEKRRMEKERERGGGGGGRERQRQIETEERKKKSNTFKLNAHKNADEGQERETLSKDQRLKLLYSFSRCQTQPLITLVSSPSVSTMVNLLSR